MDEATKSKIFDPFFTTKVTGRGLGLAAVSGILRALHGAIRVYSAPGQGTTFSVLFPAVAPEANPKQPKRAPKPRRASGTILVIDDDDLVRQAVRSALEKSGFEVLSAANGKTGVDLFREQSGRISLVILDLTMPVMSGDTAFDLLRAIQPHIPILLASGYDETDAEARAANKEFCGFLQKPFDVNQLTEAVASALGLEKD